MHTHWCVLIEILMEIGMLNFWLGLLVTALMEETYFSTWDVPITWSLWSLWSQLTYFHRKLFAEMLIGGAK